MKRIGVLYHADTLMHVTDFTRPWMESFESPQRIALTLDFLRKSDLSRSGEIDFLEGKRAEVKDVLRVHHPYIFHIIDELSKMGRGIAGELSYVSRGTFKAALAAAGTAIKAGELVVKGVYDQCFALIRPPGHHAGVAHAEGLCFFNNVAVMIRYLQEEIGIGRIMVVDWDAHASDGTSQIFYDDDTVLVLSFHEYDFDQGERGGVQEIGYGEGEGYNVNVPLPLGTAEDCYFDVFVEFFEPLARDFRPDLIVVSAGFDAHFADPVGNMNLRSKTFFRLSEEVLKVAGRVCSSKIVFVLEGGYNLLALPLSVSAVLYGLIGVEVEFYDDIGVFKTSNIDKRKIDEVIKELKDILSRYWKNI